MIDIGEQRRIVGDRASHLSQEISDLLPELDFRPRFERGSLFDFIVKVLGGDVSRFNAKSAKPCAARGYPWLPPATEADNL